MQTVKFTAAFILVILVSENKNPGYATACSVRTFFRVLLCIGTYRESKFSRPSIDAVDLRL